jgi:hypothetical protein
MFWDRQPRAASSVGRVESAVAEVTVFRDTSFSTVLSGRAKDRSVGRVMDMVVAERRASSSGDRELDVEEEVPVEEVEVDVEEEVASCAAEPTPLWLPPSVAPRDPAPEAARLPVSLPAEAADAAVMWSATPWLLPLEVSEGAAPKDPVPDAAGLSPSPGTELEEAELVAMSGVGV